MNRVRLVQQVLKNISPLKHGVHLTSTVNNDKSGISYTSFTFRKSQIFSCVGAKQCFALSLLTTKKATP